MDRLIDKSILDLPDEVIELVMDFLSLTDIMNLSTAGSKFADCAKRVLKRKTFKIAIIGGYNSTELTDIEVISLVKNSVFLDNKDIPYLPKGLSGLRGTQMPSGDLLLCGGGQRPNKSDEYLFLKDCSDQWKNVGSTKTARIYHSSVFIDGCLYTSGGYEYNQPFITHEEFSFEKGVKERKEMPIALYGHTATIFGQGKILIAGGCNMYSKISNRTFIYDINENSWTEGPSLLTERYFHCGCAIQSNDGSIQSIFVIGGCTPQEKWYSKSTEILNMKDKKWVQGPTLPSGVFHAACVALPPTHDYACVIVGGSTIEETHSSNVYGLNKSLSQWTHLGKIRTGRQSHIALPFS